MTEDEEHRRLETAHTIAELLRTEAHLREGQEITLDLFFLPGPEADPEGAMRRLKMFGYAAELDEDGTLIAQSPPVPLSVEAVWQQEQRTAALAAQHGYEPDGWGFMEP